MQTHDQFELPKQMVLRAATALMLALWLGRLALLKRWEWRRSSLDIPVLVWTAWQLFKCLPGQTPSVSISWRGEYENFNGGLTQLNYAALFFITTQHLRRWSEVDFARRTHPLPILVGAALSALGALLWPIAAWRRW